MRTYIVTVKVQVEDDVTEEMVGVLLDEIINPDCVPAQAVGRVTVEVKAIDET